MTPHGPMDAETRRSFWLCVGNGALYTMGAAFFAYETVMAGLVFDLTRSAALAGLMTSMAAVGWLWPQLFVGGFVEHLPRKLPVYRASVVVRTLAVAAMLAAMLLLPHRPGPLYAALLAGTAFYAIGGGVCMIPFMDIVAKTVPERYRHMLFAYRRMFGGVLGVLAGLGAAWLLSPASGLAYPHNYALLFALALVLHASGYLLFLQTHEPPDAHAAPARVPFLEYLRRGPGIWRGDPAFRRYFQYRMPIAFALATESLIVPYLMIAFDAPLRDTGWLAATVTAAVSLSSIAWGWLSARCGVAVLLRAAALALTLPAALLCALQFAAPNPEALEALRPWYLPGAIAVLALQAAGRNALEIGGAVYLLSLPPAGRRPTYLAFMNTLIAPLTFMPAAAGLLAQHSYTAAFACAAAGGIAAAALTLVLPPARI